MQLKFSGTSAKKGSKAAKTDAKKARATLSALKACSKPAFVWIKLNKAGNPIGNRAWALCGSHTKPKLVAYNVAETTKNSIAADARKAARDAKATIKATKLAADKAELDAKWANSEDSIVTGVHGYRKRRKTAYKGYGKARKSRKSRR